MTSDRRHRAVFARRLLICAALVYPLTAAVAADQPSFSQLDGQFAGAVRPTLQKFCLECHSTDTKEGELDLERFRSFAEVRRDPEIWRKAEEFLANGEMPPKDNPQPTVEERKFLIDWIKNYLRAEAKASAGDPGPVLLRRLNNAEYTYTIRDLTRIALDPAREFPVDGAAGEGFRNTGNALSMSPSLVEKYLAAAKEVAAHAVLLPDGIQFSERTTRSDWTNERIFEIQQIYRRHTSGNQDVRSFDRWTTPDALTSTDKDGRIDVTPYLTALVRHRDRLVAASDAAVVEIAKSEKLNTRYLKLLRGLLVGEEQSLLNGALSRRLRQAELADVPAIIAGVNAWQQALWRFNTVGHLGLVRPWQEPVAPVSTARDFRVKIEPAANADEMTLYLLAGPAGAAERPGQVLWRNPRFERAGAAPVSLRDVRGALAVFERIRTEALAKTPVYLAAAFEAKTTLDPAGRDGLAARYGIDSKILGSWLDYLGIGDSRPTQFGETLHQSVAGLGGYEFLSGWLLPGQADLSVVANSSDRQVNVPGEMRPHHIAVHPRPERWIAACWRSPLDGSIKIAATIRHAHPGCGNGVSWSLELIRGSRRRTFKSGVVNVAGKSDVAPDTIPVVKKGDLIALVIGPRDQNHFCDLTEIELRVAETTGSLRVWSLTEDCADSITKGNPHADRYGNAEVWHFTSGLLDAPAGTPVIPDSALLARWLETTDKTAADQIALQITELLTKAAEATIPPADLEVKKTLVAPGGPLFGRIDFAELAKRATPKELEESKIGVSPGLFTALEGGVGLTTAAGTSLEIRIPAAFFRGSEFVVSAELASSSSEHAIVQPDVRSSPQNAGAEFSPGVPLIVRANSPAERAVRRSFDDFRSLFPLALCYARIVPIDEVVTLILFHREDEHLARLMLDEEEKGKLDRLWEELHFVSQDALRLEVALEQILEFATQDADPKRFDPVRKPIADGASAFRKKLLAAEPQHLNAVIRFAQRAFRRPLADDEAASIRSLYAKLRGESVTHDDSIRLLLVRVLTAPAFLYKLEQPGPSRERKSVTDAELAVRLSYFLWSSCPDEKLVSLAEAGKLGETESLNAQTRRMLRDDRIRRLAVEFACQWFHIRGFDQNDEKSLQHFPEFADLKDDMYEESVRFFTNLFQNNESVLSILGADHTFVNGPLAAHYGLAGVQGDEWRRVEGMRSRHRGGILTQATFLASQSGASRTSPILRGNWISETLLNERLPRPPKGVPQLPETPPAGLTERQLIEKHSSVESCAKCHARIDPFGFALENFDALGRWRTRDGHGLEIDAKTRLRDQTPIDGIEGLRNYLLTARRDDFVRQFCRKLLGFALGRAVQLSDEPLLDEMMRRLAEQNYRSSVAIQAIVLSDQFRMIRGKEDPSSPAEP